MKHHKPSQELAESGEPDADLWVFGYGSLIWRPGFDFEEKQTARLFGAHRALCVYSFHLRGTPEQPGLVLGLDRGGSCLGMAFRVAAVNVAATRAYLQEREMLNFVYREVFRRVTLADGRQVEALAYVVERAHRQYARGLSRDELLKLVRQGQGQAGPCQDYVRNTVAALAELGISDEMLASIADAL